MGNFRNKPTKKLDFAKQIIKLIFASSNTNAVPARIFGFEKKEYIYNIMYLPKFAEVGRIDLYVPISRRTMMTAKKELGIKSKFQNNVRYWCKE